MKRMSLNSLNSIKKILLLSILWAMYLSMCLMVRYYEFFFFYV